MFALGKRTLKRCEFFTKQSVFQVIVAVYYRYYSFPANTFAGESADCNCFTVCCRYFNVIFFTKKQVLLFFPVFIRLRDIRFADGWRL